MYKFKFVDFRGLCFVQGMCIMPHFYSISIQFFSLFQRKYFSIYHYFFNIFWMALFIYFLREKFRVWEFTPIQGREENLRSFFFLVRDQGLLENFQNYLYLSFFKNTKPNSMPRTQNFLDLRYVFLSLNQNYEIFFNYNYN
jgi:tryptophan-rich sensory protein